MVPTEYKRPEDLDAEIAYWSKVFDPEGRNHSDLSGRLLAELRGLVVKMAVGTPEECEKLGLEATAKFEQLSVMLAQTRQKR